MDPGEGGRRIVIGNERCCKLYNTSQPNETRCRKFRKNMLVKEYRVCMPLTVEEVSFFQVFLLQD